MRRCTNQARIALFSALLLATLLAALSAPVAAANDPGHDTLYVLKIGDSNVTGSINLSSTLTAQLVQATSRFFGQNLDIRGDGSSSVAVNRLIATATDLEATTTGTLFLQKAGGLTTLGQSGTPGSLNVTGAIYEGNKRVCLADGTNCAAVGGSSSGGGWTNTTTLVNLSTITNNVDMRNLYVDNSNGMIGIGTTSPHSSLEVSDASPTLSLNGTDSTSTSTIAIFNRQVGVIQEWDVGAGIGSLKRGFAIMDATNGIEMLSLAPSTGYVGINTTNPTATLQVTGTANISGALYANGSTVCTAANGLCSSSLTLATIAANIGNYTSERSLLYANDSNMNTSKAQAANCPTGQIVQNTTASGVQCIAAAAGSGNVSTTGVAQNGYLAMFNSTSAIGKSIVSQKDNVLTINGNISMPDRFYIGSGAEASGTGAFAIGTNANASGSGTAIGYNANALGFSVAIGNSASTTTSATYSVAIGNAAIVSGSEGIAIGTSASATNDDQQIAIGSNAQAIAAYAIAMGLNAQAGSAGLGTTSSIAIGAGSVASGTYTIALGGDSQATAENSTAIGKSAIVAHNNSVALGTAATTAANNQFMVGSSSKNLNTYIYGNLSTNGYLYENNARVCTATNGQCPSGSVSGSGTNGYLAMFNSTSTIGNSAIAQSGTGLVGIGTAIPNGKLHVVSTAANQFQLHYDYTNPTAYNGAFFSVDSNGNLSVLAERYAGSQQLRVITLQPSGGLVVAGGPLNVVGNLNVAGAGTNFFNGNVGIGTTTQEAKLAVNVSSNQMNANLNGVNITLLHNNGTHGGNAFHEIGLDLNVATNGVMEDAGDIYNVIGAKINTTVNTELPDAGGQRSLEVYGIKSDTVFNGPMIDSNGEQTAYVYGISTHVNTDMTSGGGDASAYGISLVMDGTSQQATGIQSIMNTVANSNLGISSAIAGSTGSSNTGIRSTVSGGAGGVNYGLEVGVSGGTYNYGIMIGSMAVGNANYSLYVAGPAQSVFGGKVGIAPGIYSYQPNATLSVLGNAMIDGPAYNQPNGSTSAPTHKANLTNATGGAQLGSPRGVFVAGNYAYVISSNSLSLEIVDISNPAAPVHKGNISNGVGGAQLNGTFGLFVAGKYAYVASYYSNALEIIDISNPAAPVHKGNISNGVGGALLSGAYSVFVSGNYAYVTALSNNALEIIDVSNPANPTHKGNISNGAAVLLNPYSVFVSGNYAYVVAQTSNNLEIIDISNPAIPTHKANLTNATGGAQLSGPNSVFVAGSYAYVASQQSNALEIIDISNPAAPTHKGNISNGVGGAQLNQPYSVFVAGNNAYVASYASNALEIIDISNPAAPVHKGNISSGVGGARLSSPSSVFISGNNAYVTSIGYNALEIIDVSGLSVSNIQVGAADIGSLSVKSFAQFDQDAVVRTNLIVGGNAMVSGVLSVNGSTVCTAANGYCVASTSAAGWTSNTQNTTTTLNVGIGTATPSTKLDVNGSSSIDGPLANYPIGSTASPTHKGNISHGVGGAYLGYPYSVFVAGKYAYVAASNSQALEIVDISNPASPTHKGSITAASGAPISTPKGVFVSGNYAYVTGAGSNALEIIDVSNPANPTHKGNLSTGVGGAQLSAPWGIFVAGSYAYVTSPGSNALEIIDVSNPANPTHKGNISNGVGGAQLNYPQSVYVAGNYAYVASYTSGALEIIDISNPANPTHKGNISNGVGGAQIIQPYSVFVAGNYAYVASYGSNALEIVDISNATNPTHKGSLLNTVGGAQLSNPTSVFVAGNNAYVTSQGSNALEIVDVSNPASPTHKSNLTNTTVGPQQLLSPQGVFVVGNYAYVTSYYGNALEIVDVSGLAVSNMQAGAADVGSLSVRSFAQFEQNVQVNSHLNVGGNAKVDGALGVGSVITVNANGNPAAAGQGSLLVIGDVNKERVEIRSFAAGPTFQSWSGHGSVSTPTATTANDMLFNLAAAGTDDTGARGGNTGLIWISAAGAFTTASQPTYISFITTPTGATSAGRLERMRIDQSGYVGIATTQPNATLHVVGKQYIGYGAPHNATGTYDLWVNGSIEYETNLYGPGADVAELINSSGQLEAGDVVVADPNRTESIMKSTFAYDTAVVGVVSTDPSYIMSKRHGDTPLALTGRVPIKVSAENGAIKPGDLLTTSSTPGYAMRCASRQECQGAIVAKALGTLENGTGKITGLVMLG